MTPRERVLAVLNRRQPDKVPWFGDLDYRAAAQVFRGQRPANFRSSPEYLDWHRDLGVGFYLQGVYPFAYRFRNMDIREWKEGNDRYREFITPKGRLRECWTWIPQAITEGPTEHLLKSAADLPAYNYIRENTGYEYEYPPGESRFGPLGGIGVSLAYLPKSPFMQLVALDAGIITAVEIMEDAPALFEETMIVAKESHDRAAALTLKCPAEILMIPENLSSEVVGPELFHRYMEPFQVEWAARIKAAGKFSCIHMDGTLRGLLREEFQVGLTFVESITPAPVGDLRVEEWSDFVGPTDTLFWGGIPGSYFTPLVSDAEFDAHVRNTISVMRREPRYVLGIADQIPPDGLESRLRRVTELVEEHGAY